MKRLLALLSFVFVSTLVTGQSVLITPGAQSINGDSTNQNQLSAFGNGVLVGPRAKFTDIDPASNVLNMSCATPMPEVTLAGTLKDPGGDVAYFGGFAYDCEFVLETDNVLFLAYQIDFLSFSTEADGDTLFVLNYYTSEILGAYSGSTLPDRLILNNKKVKIRFKTDGDNYAGSGFVLTWKAILIDGPHTAVKNYLGEGLVYDGASRSLWLGKHNPSDFDKRGTASIAMGTDIKASGNYSTAIGYNVKASGISSIAVGSNSDASGDYSITLGGYGTKASNTYSLASGYETEASGVASVAMGYETKSSGHSSLAMGYNANSSGPYSTAMGSWATTHGHQGAVVLGDFIFSSEDSLAADAVNRFVARFDNGYKFYTNNELSNTSIGLMALHNANSWSSISDSTKKENFIASNGEEVLKSVSQMRIGTWNYKGQNARRHRHWGVMAQDFHHHFGRDAYGTIGNDTTIATADFDGVSFAAIKALEERTKKLQSDLASEKRFSASPLDLDK